MKKEITELKVYVEGVLRGKLIIEQMGYCEKCGKWEDLRFGYCFDCVFEICPFETCGFKRLVYCGQGRKQIWKNCQYVGLNGKVYCDRDEGLCAKAKNLRSPVWRRKNESN